MFLLNFVDASFLNFVFVLIDGIRKENGKREDKIFVCSISSKNFFCKS